MKKLVFMLFVVAATIFCPATDRLAVGEESLEIPTAFRHPGLLHTRESLTQIREKIASGEEPWTSAFEIFRKDRFASKDYRMRGPFASVSRLPHRDSTAADQDYRAAYFNALMWALTGRKEHADKAKEILDAYSEHFEGFSDEDRDRQLTASLGPFLLVNAAEIIRHTEADWPDAEVRRFETFLREKILPSIRDFAPFANGNWDTGCLKTVLAIGVFCDDPEVFRLGVDYYLHGKGNGRLEHYVVNESGQCQESGRDQQHAQLGLGHLAEAAEIAWNQGLDLYGVRENRLLAGFEYTARYNMGEDVPFEPHDDTTGKYRHRAISDKGRGTLRPIYEMVRNHYAGRKNIPAPETTRAAESLRPEGPAFAADHPGYGTLLFTLP